MKNKPSTEQIVNGMKEKFGEGTPKSVEYLAKISPETLLTQINSSADSMSDPNSPFDPKFRTFIYLATAIATNSQSCIKAQYNAAIKQGATKNEILAVIKIVRHAASSSVYGNAEYVLENLTKI